MVIIAQILTYTVLLFPSGDSVKAGFSCGRCRYATIQARAEREYQQLLRRSNSQAIEITGTKVQRIEQDKKQLKKSRLHLRFKTLRSQRKKRKTSRVDRCPNF